MERYLEGEEIGGEELSRRARSGRVARRALPGRLRRRDPEPRDHRPARPARRGHSLAGREARRGREQRHRGLRLQDRRRPVRRADHGFPRALGHVEGRLDARQHEDEGKGAARPADAAPGQGAPTGARVRRRRHRRRRQAEGDGHGRRSVGERHGDRDRADRLPAAGHELRGHAEGEGRRGEGHVRASAPGARRIRPSSCGATSRPASSSSPG